MKPVQPAELSALLDGELETSRKAEVEAALAGDPALQAQFLALKSADQRWRKAAHAASFQPQIDLGQQGSTLRSATLIVLAVIALIILRFAPKFIDVTTFGIALHIVALVVLLYQLVVMLNDQPVAYSQTSAGTPK